MVLVDYINKQQVNWDIQSKLLLPVFQKVINYFVEFYFLKNVNMYNYADDNSLSVSNVG